MSRVSAGVQRDSFLWPVLTAGKPSGETMAIKSVDDHHLTALLKMNGKTFSTSKSTLSADGKVTEVWVKKCDARQLPREASTSLE
jgi:hypothetical protein